MAAVGLVILSPLLGLLMMLVRITSPGPAIHWRRVLGYGGQEFDAFKLRTMVENADSFWEDHPDLWREFQRNHKLRNDPRVTPLGRWLRRTSLDELPQLVNVLRGEMSLVGPRMITAPELRHYGQWQDLLLTIRPGLTGLWQVSGRQTLSFEQRVELDVDYLLHWSLLVDLKILVRTIPAVLSGRGAC